MNIQKQIDEAKKNDLSGREAAKAEDFDKAARFFDKAAKIFESIDDDINRAQQLFSLAGCFQILKQYNQALDTFKISYELIKGNAKLLEHQAMTLNNIGLLCVNLKRYNDSISSFEKACEIYENLNNENGKAFQLQNIGSVHRDLNENKKALELYYKSVTIFQKTGNRLGESNQYSNIAYIYFAKNNIEDALKWYKKALAVYVDIHEDKKAKITEKNIERLEDLQSASFDDSTKV